MYGLCVTDHIYLHKLRFDGLVCGKCGFCYMVFLYFNLYLWRLFLTDNIIIALFWFYFIKHGMDHFVLSHSLSYIVR